MQNKSVLLITSAQVDLLAESGKAWGLTQPTEEKNLVRNHLTRLLQTAREKKIPIIHSPVGFNYELMKGYSPLNPIQQVIVENRLLEINTQGCDFIAEALPQRGDIILPYRQGFSSFWAKSIQEELEKLEADTIYIAGMLAEGCIESHVRDGVENGYAVKVVKDAVGSTSLELLDASFKSIALHAAELVTTENF